MKIAIIRNGRITLSQEARQSIGNPKRIMITSYNGGYWVRAFRPIKSLFHRHVQPPDGQYRMSRHGRRLYLTDHKLAKHDIFWETIEGYHEHLPIEQQCARVRRRSRRLAGMIKTGSILEYGCGSGRNLYYIDCKEKYGIEINAQAATLARRIGVNILSKNIYMTDNIPDEIAETVLSSGVLMHVPPAKLDLLLKEMYRTAKKQVIIIELHGQAYSFDHHRYPRRYLPIVKSIFPECDINRRRWRDMELIIIKKPNEIYQ